MTANNIPTPPTQLQYFQDAYSRYLRAPHEESLPEGIPPRRSRVYEELLFNNVCGFLDRCFPVARSLLDENAWRRLNRHFYQNWQCHTPYFSRIPLEFVRHIQKAAQELELSDWFAELLDYEWRELDVDLHPGKVPRVHLPSDDNYRLKLNPSLQNLQYQWPVHHISKSNIPDASKPTFLLVYRSYDHRVHFMEVNALTSALLQILHEAPAHPNAAIAQLADLMPTANRQALQEFGAPLLLDLLQRNVLVLA
ncbi:MAG TPA: putative DNA-binding domain-containing protein [Cellvibrio sp.]|nr:putative DNA-binding domain-containing protein [Cellvibrio sp.]